jgi:hypothetical protein
MELARADLPILIVVRYVSHQGRFRRRLLDGDFSRSFRRHNSETFLRVQKGEGLQHTGQTEEHCCLIACKRISDPTRYCS